MLLDLQKLEQEIPKLLLHKPGTFLKSKKSKLVAGEMV